MAGNWVVTLLEREGHRASVAGVAGGLVLFAGIITRPLGGLIVRRAPDRAWGFVSVTLIAGSIGALALAAAVGFVNGCAVLVILACTPLAGLTFGLPGNGRLAVLAIGLLWATSLVAVRRANHM